MSNHTKINFSNQHIDIWVAQSIQNKATLNYDSAFFFQYKITCKLLFKKKKKYVTINKQMAVFVPKSNY